MTAESARDSARGTGYTDRGRGAGAGIRTRLEVVVGKQHWIGGWMIAACALCANALDGGVAPDGKRGFGAAIKASEALSLMRSAKAEDQAFLADLDGLATEVAVLGASTLERYRARGYVDVLPRTQEPTLEALHERFADLEREPFDVLTRGGAQSRALARMLVDSRFRARARVLETFALEVREVRRSMAVLRGACDGFVLLSQADAGAIAARVDLSAALLRSMRNDLLALRQVDEDVDVDRRADALLAVATASEGEGVRRAAVQREVEGAWKMAQSMERALFTLRLRGELRALLEWRARVFEESVPLREEALQQLPDTEQGRAAPDEIRKLAKHDRMRGAGYRALKVLAIDPLDDEAAWIAAHSADFLYGIAESRPWYDRFLAIRGIRSHDHRTYVDRALEPREREALDAIQRALLGG